MKMLTFSGMAAARLKSNRRGYLSLAIGVFLSIFLITTFVFGVYGIVNAQGHNRQEKVGIADMVVLDNEILNDEKLLELGSFDRLGHAYVTGMVEGSSLYLGHYDSTGAELLCQEHTLWNGIAIGALGSGLMNPAWIPDLSMLEGFAAAPGYRLLLCHHPEYFNRYLRPYPIDLIISGHAHGGQWRVFGRGVYAPDQGLFPKYTAGMHENRLIISRGVANSVAGIPRIFNPFEVVTVEVNAKCKMQNQVRK